jgi:hypothetical protein
MARLTMQLPGLVEGGVLPAGIHDCTLDEVAEVFASSAERAALWERFIGFLERLNDTLPMPVTIYLDGSFISDWESCCDIDVVIEAREFEGENAQVLSMLCDERVRAEFLNDFGVMIHVLVPGFFSRDYRAWFQRVKSDDAWRFGMDPTLLKKGIVRLSL